MSEHVPESIASTDVGGDVQALSLDAPIHDVVQCSEPIADVAMTATESETGGNS